MIDTCNLYLFFKTRNSSDDSHTNAKSKETCNHLDSTPSDERSDVVWIVVITLLGVIVAICTIFHWINKKRKEFKV